MPLVAAHELSPDDIDMEVYNSYDSAIPLEVLGKLKSLPAFVSNSDPSARQAYAFSRGLQGPALDMMLRGILVDPNIRERALIDGHKKLERLLVILNQFTEAVAGRTINPNSGAQIKNLFYQIMGIPEIHVRKGNEVKTPMDRDVLERITDYFDARPIANIIIQIRDIQKQLQTMESEVDQDWRFRTSINITGTSTFRFSSSKSSSGGGSNLQNWRLDWRHMFISDPGYTMYGMDLEQAESREVGLICGLLFDDWSYLDACLSGDLHSAVTRMVYPEWQWTGDIKKDRAIAEREFQRGKSYRDGSKTLGHGCLTTDHEVLTPEGWVPIAQKPLRIRQFDTNTGNSQFVKVSEWTDGFWSGDFHIWDGFELSATMNAPHRVYYMTSRSRQFQVCPVTDVPEDALIPLGWGRFVPLNHLAQKIKNTSARVLCPTVPSGAFFIRRNERISVTGNSNYLGRPRTMSKHSGFPIKHVMEFQDRYFAAFPGIPRWHQWVAQELQTKQHLYNVFGLRRDFFDRPDSDDTIRAAVAFMPQSATANRLNLGMWRIWKHMPYVQILLQLHDAVYFQAPNKYSRQEIAARAQELMSTKFYLPSGRVFDVPSEIKAGYSLGNRWAKDKAGNLIETNPRGLDKIKL